MSSNHLQQNFLSELRSEASGVSVFLVSGIKLQGTIVDFDESTIGLGSSVNSVVQLVYKHAISSIVPEENRNKVNG